MRHRKDKADQPTLLLETSLQLNMWNKRHETQQPEQIIKIISKMLYHDRTERPACDDIIDIMKESKKTVKSTAVTNDGE